MENNKIIQIIKVANQALSWQMTGCYFFFIYIFLAISHLGLKHSTSLYHSLTLQTVSRVLEVTGCGECHNSVVRLSISQEPISVARPHRLRARHRRGLTAALHSIIRQIYCGARVIMHGSVCTADRFHRRGWLECGVIALRELFFDALRLSEEAVQGCCQKKKTLCICVSTLIYFEVSEPFEDLHLNYNTQRKRLECAQNNSFFHLNWF